MRAYRKTALMWRRAARESLQWASHLKDHGDIWWKEWACDCLLIIRDHGPIQVRKEAASLLRSLAG